MSMLLRLLILLLVPQLAYAGSSLASAQRAAELLGPDVWSEVIKIEHRGPSTEYPSTVYATVFELAGILWFYTDVNGTQSFSVYRGRLAQDKADILPLLHAIDPGFVHYSVADRRVTVPPAPRPFEQIPNGCFIESYVAWRDQLIARGEPVQSARLLSFFAEHKGEVVGHTVLTYETAGGQFVLDASKPHARPVRLPRITNDEAVAVASAVRPDLRIVGARWIMERHRDQPWLLASASAAAPHSTTAHRG